MQRAVRERCCDSVCTLDQTAVDSAQRAHHNGWRSFVIVVAFRHERRRANLSLDSGRFGEPYAPLQQRTMIFRRLHLLINAGQPGVIEDLGFCWRCERYSESNRSQLKQE